MENKEMAIVSRYQFWKPSLEEQPQEPEESQEDSGRSVGCTGCDGCG